MNATKAFWSLAGVFAVFLFVHVRFLGSGLDQLDREIEFAYEQSIQINSAPGNFRVRMYLPRSGQRTQIREESLETTDLDVDFQTDETGRMLIITGNARTLPRTVTYRASVATRSVNFRTTGSSEWKAAAIGDSLALAATRTIQAGDPSLFTPLHQIMGLGLTTEFGEDSEWNPADWQAAFHRINLSPLIVVARIYAYCHDQISPARFSGTTDALTTLRLGEASCGGKSRLMAALCRTVGIPCQLVGGVIIGQTSSKRTHHVWLECRQGDQWVPFDPLNGHFASLPDKYLRLYTSDKPLISYSRGLAFDYGFRSPRKVVPKVWAETGGEDESSEGLLSRLVGQRIPLLERGGFSLILLAPFALLFIVFARQVVGFESIGVFLPILLGFSLTQTGWLYGGAQILLCILLGAGLRLLLSGMNLLHVPRAAVMITSVILLFLLFSVLQLLAGHEVQASELILPLAALAMAVEKFIVVAMDKGAQGAFWLLAQTLVLTVGCAVILTNPLYQQLMIAYPEIILLVIALIIMVGNYRGLRWREQLRFRSILGGGESS